MLITTSWHAGELDMARKDAKRLVDTCPEFRIIDIRRWPFRDPEHWDRFTRGLIETSLPE